MFHLTLLITMLIPSPFFQSTSQTKNAEIGYTGADAYLCRSSKRPRNDIEAFCLRGKVKTIKEESKGVISQNGGWVDGPVVSYSSKFYDERGNRIEAVINNASSNLRGYAETRHIYGFDGQGRATGWKAYHEGNSEPAAIITYAYDEKGNRIKEETIHTNGSVHAISVFSYDDAGRRVEEIYDNPTGKGRNHKDIYTYVGNAVHKVSYSKEGAVVSSQTTTNDEETSSATLEQRIADVQGKLMLTRQISVKYDNEGRVIESRYHKAEAQFGAKAIYEYDDKSNITSMTRYKADGTFAIRELFKHEYDAQGNWVTLVRLMQYSENGEPLPYRVERRIIAYY